MRDIEQGQCKTLKVSEIEPSKLNARDQSIESPQSEKFVELCDSIKSEGGLIEPIVVRKVPNNGKYEAIAGTRRLRALKHLGIDQTTVIVKQMGDNDVRIASLVENIHRDDLLEDEKEATLKDIYLAAWDEWKPKDWYEIMPRQKNIRTGKVETFDCSTEQGKLVLARQFLSRLVYEGRFISSRNKSSKPQIIFPTTAFKTLRERVGYAAGTQARIIAGYGSGSLKQNYIEELPPLMRKKFEEDERIRKLDEQKKRELAEKIHRKTSKKLKTKQQMANEITDKFLKELEKPKPVFDEPRQERKKTGSVQEAKLSTNPVRAREAIIVECSKLFKTLTTMDLENTLAQAERQAKSVQARNTMKEIANFYVRERELANLQAIIIPVNIALSTFRDLVYEAIEAQTQSQRQKNDFFKP